MVDVRYEFEGDDELKKLMQDIKGKGKNLSVPMKRAGVLMLGSIGKNFDAQGRPDKWSPLSQWTLDRRRKEGKGAKILQETGRLKQSMSYKLEGDNEVAIGTNVEYAKLHNEGGSLKVGKRTAKIPKRTFLMFQEEDKENIVKIFSEYLEEITK
jgi:phage virion morphogenesis protein